MTSLSFTAVNLEETQKLAKRVGALLHPGDILTLDGPLGAGKTAFARALIQGLIGQDQEVPSPTFTLVQTYDIRDLTLWHFDLYRLEHPEEIWELGFEEVSGGIALIEWPQRACALGLFQQALALTLSQGINDDERLITLTGHDSWSLRLQTLQQDLSHGPF